MNAAAPPNPVHTPLPFGIRSMREADLDFTAGCTAAVDWPSETRETAVAAFRSLTGLAEQPGSWHMVLGSSDRLGNSPLCWAVGSPAKG
jgi:hypothetical protein